MSNQTELRCLYGSASLGGYQPAVEQAITLTVESRVAMRIWEHDHTLWKPKPKEISDRFGWLHIAEEIRTDAGCLGDLVTDLSASGFTDALLVGMGGSSLAPDLFAKTFVPGVVESRPFNLTVLDSTEPNAILAQTHRLDPARTVLVVSTKSGNTLETLSLFKFFYNWLGAVVEEPGDRCIAITDKNSNLDVLASDYDFRATFLGEPTIGGRYSALSYFGLAPAALCGVDVAGLLDSSQRMATECGPAKLGMDNPAIWLGAILGVLAKQGRDKLTIIAPPELGSFGDWAEQLLAESTGKEGKGIVPVVHEPLDRPSAYGDDRAFVHLHLDRTARRAAQDDAALESMLLALQAAGHPVVRVDLKDLYELGGQFFLWEMATAVAAHLLGVNPFDQPDVESTKVKAREMIAEFRRNGALPAGSPALTDGNVTVFGQDVRADTSVEALKAFLDQGSGHPYVALQAYLPPSPSMDEALARLRLQIRNRTHWATTVGYGPRFLHSTGQLHKGDAGIGLFVQLTADPAEDVPIPDEPGADASSVSFGVLTAAEALGDWHALQMAHRKVIRFHLGGDVLGGLSLLTRGIGRVGSAR